MLVLPPLDPGPVDGRVSFADHAVDHRCYVLPNAVSVARAADGGPDFVVLRYRDQPGTLAGGTLRTTLAWPSLATATAPGWDVRPVPFQRVRYRLTRRVVNQAGAPAVGPWQVALRGDADVAVVAFSLSAAEVQVVEDLLDGGNDLLDVEVEATYSALVPGVPWLASADGTALWTRLRAILGDGAVAGVAIDAAFSSLPVDPSPFTLTALRPGAAPPDPRWVAAEVGKRAPAVLFHPAAPSGGDATGADAVAAAYRLTDTPASSLTFDLLVPRVEEATVDLAWSVAALMAELDDSGRRAAFPAVGSLDPFQVVTLAVLCDLPFDERGLQAVQVDLNYPSAAGVPASRGLRFPAGGAVQRVQAVVPPGGGGLEVLWKCHATIAPIGGQGWPAVVTGGQQVQSTPVVTVDRRALGLDFVRIAVDPAVYEVAETVAVSVTRPVTADAVAAVATLDASHPAAWMVLPGVAADEPLVATVTATAAQPVDGPVGATATDPAGESPAPVVLRQAPVVDRQVVVSEADVLLPGPERVLVGLADRAGDQFAYVAATVLGPRGGDGETRQLIAGESVAFAVVRATVFDPLRYRYQLLLVAYDANGATLPMTTTDWVDAQGTELHVDPSPVPVP